MSQNASSYKHYYGYAPASGPKFVGLSAVLTSGALTQSFDLVAEQADDVIEYIQSIYIDNSANAQPVAFTFGTSNQKVQIPANSQGYLPVLCPNPPHFTVSATAAGTVNFLLLNNPVPATVWKVQ